jgi:hypothetical protein
VSEVRRLEIPGPRSVIGTLRVELLAVTTGEFLP